MHGAKGHLMFISLMFVLLLFHFINGCSYNLAVISMVSIMFKAVHQNFSFTNYIEREQMYVDVSHKLQIKLQIVRTTYIECGHII